MVAVLGLGLAMGAGSPPGSAMARRRSRRISRSWRPRPCGPATRCTASSPTGRSTISIAAHLRATDATTIALFSVTHTATGEIAADQNGYRAITGSIGRQIVADAHAAKRRVDVDVDELRPGEE